MRHLIVNADDLGYDPEIDRGILEAHGRGIVTCASAMVDTPFAKSALRAAPPTLAVGLHAVLDPSSAPAAARRALRRQLERFGELRGSPPSHLDSHRHVHAGPALFPVFVEVAAGAGLPLRVLDPPMRRAARARGVVTADAFLGDAALRPCWTAERLLEALRTLPEGTSELMAHPGYAPRQARTSFGREREEELAALCDPRARVALAEAGALLARWGGERGRGPPAG